MRLGILIWLFAVHLIGIYLFTRGFLLTRLSLPGHTTCSGTKACTLPPTHKRAVFLIIDALRFDFVSPNPPLPPSPYHHNVLTLPHQLSEKYPTRSFLFNSYVDPPTTTLQRIKGLTTGSLPTFIDMGSNFGASSISEDSILKQLQLAGKTSAFMGDDTWMSVFPDTFHPNMTFPYDSFNVEDLHTVDSGVIAHLFPLLEDPSKPFDFLVGHFLGVDHVGHRVGPDHPSMHAKLKQMNDVLARVVEKLDDETLLVVLGDHGMDRAGDHGGDGVLETSAALWIYSKGPKLMSATSSPPSGLLQYKIFPGCPVHHRSIQQIDILPTISLLLGLPIPFNSLGSIIPEIFWRAGTGDDLSQALQINADQVKNYLGTYRSSPSGGELDESWATIQKSWDAIQASSHHLEARLITLNNFNRVSLSTCRSLWAQFDPVLMGAGLAVLFIGLLSAGFVYASLSEARNDWQDWVKAYLPPCILAAGFGCVVGLITHSSLSSFFPGIGRSDWTLFFAAVFSCLSLVITTSSSLTLTTISSMPIILVLHACAFFSNSWTFWEDRMIPFLLGTSILVNFAPTGFTAPTPYFRRRILGLSALFMVCVRLMAISTVCREEQHPYCHVTFFASSSLPSPPTLVLALALPMATIVIPLVIQRVLHMTKSDTGIAGPFLSFIVRPSLVASTLFWIAEWADSTHLLGEGSSGGGMFWAVELRGMRTSLARFAFGWPVLAGLGLWWFAPLCLRMKVENVTEPATKATESQERRQITVLGYANAFGAPYLMFWLVSFCVVYASVQLTAQVVMGLAVVALLSYLEVVDSVRDVRSMESAFASGVPSSVLSGRPSAPASPTSSISVAATQIRFDEVTPIALLGLLAFYTTGHQATVSSIQWKAAFMVVETVKYPWSPLIVGTNFLGPVAAISGLGVTLVALWNRAPNLSDPKSGDPQALAQTKALAGERYDAQIKADSMLAALGVMTYFGALLVGTAMSAAILRRHLMVWKLFAPRFMTAAIHLLAVDLAALFGVGLGVGRVSDKIGSVFKGVVKE